MITLQNIISTELTRDEYMQLTDIEKLQVIYTLLGMNPMVTPRSLVCGNKLFRYNSDDGTVISVTQSRLTNMPSNLKESIAKA